MRAKWHAAHDGCAVDAARFADQEARKESLLGRGAFVRCSAIGFGDGLVRVTFRNAEGVYRDVDMSRDVYRAVPLDEPATFASFYPADHSQAWEEVLA